MSRFMSGRLAALEAYVPGEQPRDVKYIKLNTNESPFPPSPLVLERLDRAAVAELNLYPDPTGRALGEKLATHYGVAAENVMLGNGSDEILAFCFMAFCDAGRGIAYPAISYGFYPVYARLFGLERAELALMPDFTMRTADYYGLGKTIVIANPNAPTGIALSRSEIEEIVRRNPDTVVMIDEAYVDFGAESAVSLTKQYENLLVIQTYSKARSLAGGRLGYAIGDRALIADLQRVRNSFNPYNVNRLTLIAGEAALDDREYYDQNCREIAEIREDTAARLGTLGFTMTKSMANFLFVAHQELDGKTIYEKLRERGILVRRFDKVGVSDYLRITVGTRASMDAVVGAIVSILKEVR